MDRERSWDGWNGNKSLDVSITVQGLVFLQRYVGVGHVHGAGDLLEDRHFDRMRAPV